MNIPHPTDNGPKRGPMSSLELRARLAIGDLGERDLDEIIGTTAKVMAAWRDDVWLRRRVRQVAPGLADALDALANGPVR